MIVGRRHTERTGRLRGSDDGRAFTTAGRAPCVVVVHGFTGTTSEVRPLADALSASGFAVRAPLLPGHGTSPAALQDTTFEDWRHSVLAETRIAMRDHGTVVLAGFSLGSLVVMDIAADRPAGLVGLVALGNPLELSPPLDTVLGLVAARAVRVPDWYLLKVWSPDVRDRAQRSRVRDYDRDPLRAALEVHKGAERVRARLERVACPTLVLHGGRDRVCPPRNARRLAEALGPRCAGMRVFPDSGHLVAVDRERAEVAREVTAFVERLSAQAPVEP